MKQISKRIRSNKIKLKRSKKDKIISGVLGGLGEYLGIDSTLIRITWLIFMALTGFVPTIIVYIAASIILPMSKS